MTSSILIIIRYWVLTYRIWNSLIKNLKNNSKRVYKWIKEADSLLLGGKEVNRNNRINNNNKISKK